MWVMVEIGRCFAVCVLTLPLLAQSDAQAPLFPDRNLEAAVREQVLDKRNSDKPLTEQDVANLSTVSGKGKGIRDLTGLNKCKRLASLDLSDNQITDLGPLQELTGLQFLNLPKNQIQDLKPLSKLTELQYLDLSDNRVDDVEPLRPLVKLTTLHLSNNRIHDARPLAELKRLWTLNLDGNRVAALQFVQELKTLSTLSLRGNGVINIAPLTGLTELRYLFLENNKVQDISVLVAMARKDAEKEMRFASYWNVYLTGNPLTGAARKTQLPKLKRFGGVIVFDIKKPTAAPVRRSRKR